MVANQIFQSRSTGPLHHLVRFLCILTFLVVAGVAHGATDERHRIWDELLGRYVHNQLVDYAGFKSAENRLDQYLDQLAATDTAALIPKEALAFYINAYNAWTVKLILTGYPGIKSIKELGTFFESPWKKKLARIDGDVISLDQIEHDIIRRRFREPRIHFAVNCASKGCPPLLAQAYTGSRLEHQLDAVTGAFINDPQRTRLDGKVLYVSKIFKWYAADFDNDPAAFVRRFATGALKSDLTDLGAQVSVKYLDYDWSLNGK